jgi:hypothetical protein
MSETPFANYRDHPGALHGTLFGPGKSRIKWLEIALFGTILRARFQQPVDELFVNGGQEVDTKSCVGPDSCICQKVSC